MRRTPEQEAEIRYPEPDGAGMRQELYNEESRKVYAERAAFVAGYCFCNQGHPDPHAFSKHEIDNDL